MAALQSNLENVPSSAIRRKKEKRKAKYGTINRRKERVHGSEDWALKDNFTMAPDKIYDTKGNVPQSF